MEWIVVLVLVAAAALRVAAHFLDVARIRGTASLHGWSQVMVTWAPLSPGSLTEPRQRFYEVAFTDREGKRCFKTCKTSMLGGVSWIDDFTKGL